MEYLVKYIGLNSSFFQAVSSSVSVIYRILIGYFLGLPVNALSVNASISCFFSVLLEFPMGVYSDRCGKLFSIKLGLFFQFLASICLLVAIFTFKTSQTTFMWIFLVLEAVLDAVGNSLISGSQEAFYQELIDQNILEENKEEISSRIFSISEQYGRWTKFLAPISFALLTYYLETTFKAGALIIAATSIAWLALILHFNFLSNHFNHEEKYYTVHANLFKNFLSNLSFSSKLFLSNQMFMIFFLNGLVYLIFANYFIIDLLKINTIDLFKRENSIIFASLLSATTLLIRSYLMPTLSKKINLITKVNLLLLFQFIASLLCLILVRNESLIILIVFYISYVNLYGLIQKPLTGKITSNIPPEIRASFMSFLNLLILLMVSFFALLLSFSKSGTPGLKTIFYIILLTTLICIFFNNCSKNKINF